MLQIAIKFDFFLSDTVENLMGGGAGHGPGALSLATPLYLKHIETKITKNFYIIYNKNNSLDLERIEVNQH